MIKSGSRPGVLPPLAWEEVRVPPIPAHDRVPLDGVAVVDLVPYSPFPIGRKAEILRKQLAAMKD